MGRKQKDHVGTSLGELLEDVDLGEPAEERVVGRAIEAPEPPRPSRNRSEALRGDDRIAFMDAMSGVVPLDRSPPSRVWNVPREGSSADDAARARLAALVGGGVHFTVERTDDLVFGRRAGTPAAVALDLSRRGVAPEATLDLHGVRADDALRELVRFVRAQYRRGHRRVRVVHGKGLHSPGGAGVLGSVVVSGLSEGGAAPVVLAFASAHADLGGAGALIVQLVR